MGSESLGKMIAIYGFLGSGKTTVMLELARSIVARGHKAALVVNEAGDVPIDGKWLEISGLPVKEIFAGCICCTVVGDFVETLRTLAGDPSLGYILIEPSGMADAPRLFASIEKHTPFTVSKVLILDLSRLPLLLKAARPLIQGQLQTAGIILLNKLDALSAKQAVEARRLIPERTASTVLFETSALNGLSPGLINEILK
jgi:G3E family GTPase